jgi:hypothetical protein
LVGLDLRQRTETGNENLDAGDGNRDAIGPELFSCADISFAGEMHHERKIPMTVQLKADPSMQTLAQEAIAIQDACTNGLPRYSVGDDRTG